MNNLASNRSKQPPDIEERLFGSKAATLAGLSSRLKTARVLPLHRVSVAEYRRNARAAIAAMMREPWAMAPLAVRSSAYGEDGAQASQAGCYESVLNVLGPAALAVAVETVAASYGGEHAGDEVLVQPMLERVAANGVAFSVDPNTASPYAVVSIANSADTRVVTGGQSHELETVLVSRHAPSIDDPRVARVVALLHEVETLTGVSAVDIEFAFDQSGSLFLFQARPLIVNKAPSLSDNEHKAALTRIASQIEAKCRPNAFLRGSRSLFGIMPDWNPAEMIGVRPRPLALSLYRELITDEIWAYQRHNYGYRNLRGFPLLHDFSGIPFIDVRVSFNSFIPADIPGALADKLANYYLDALASHPALHDKVEFEIIFSCYTLDLPERLAVLAGAGFTPDEIAALCASLRRLTNGIINNRDGLWQTDTAKLDTLNDRHCVIRDEITDPIARIHWLMEDGKRYGTLPFAGLARAAFIAVQTLRSLVAIGALSDQDYHGFLGSLETVSSQMSRDFADLSRDAFLARYGHLRPGTYDICSPRYDAEPGLYFDWSNGAAAQREGTHAPFALTLRQMNDINVLLEKHGLEHDVVGLFNFLKAAIEGREKAKFLFTRNLSDVLECLAGLGQAYGLTREDLSYADIGSVLALYAASEDPQAALTRAIDEGRKRHAVTRAISLPALISSPDDAWYVRSQAVEPNFITQQAVRSHVVDHAQRSKLKGAIVTIPSADPGFDWLFSHGIGGLITAYGGVNSHMAIRAGELRIPAVIGAGEALFDRWSRAHTLHVDCANKRVEIIR